MFKTAFNYKWPRNAFVEATQVRSVGGNRATKLKKGVYNTRPKPLVLTFDYKKKMLILDYAPVADLDIAKLDSSVLKVNFDELVDDYISKGKQISEQLLIQYAKHNSPKKVFAEMKSRLDENKTSINIHYFNLALASMLYFEHKKALIRDFLQEINESSTMANYTTLCLGNFISNDSNEGLYNASRLQGCGKKFAIDGI